MTHSPTPAPWTIQHSESLYHIPFWGEPYFGINERGNVEVTPLGSSDNNTRVDLYELVESLKKRHLALPLLIRFSDILVDRLHCLHHCFHQAIARYHYDGRYQGVFPVKCNQNRHVVQTLVKAGQAYDFGLEAGSKPELMIALALLAQGDPQNQALLICNGYKDREYIETALLATRLHQKVIIVVEQFSELTMALDASEKLGIAPVLGIRARLATQGSGRWQNTTGERAKFGLTMPEIMAAIALLREKNALSCLQLLHFHVGSQISAIRVIKNAIREAGQIYGELVALGAPMGYLDVGGGLAVDYDGSKSNSEASKNYNLQNYANDLVAELQEVCMARGIASPTLISESGRAIASHQGVLIFDVLGSKQAHTMAPPPAQPEEHLLITNLRETYEDLCPANCQESYHDAIQFKEEAISLFNFGYLSLGERAIAEQLYLACCQKIQTLLHHTQDIPEDLASLEERMAATYYMNLSVFQSAPDAWAIDQLFPIMPIHRLGEEPTVKGILADLTCDSDGKLNRFINSHHTKELLELHPLRADQPYYLGMFLVGAYQEIMGNLHNLFGDTNVVHIKMTAMGYQVESVVKGDRIHEVLGYVQYHPEELEEIIRQRSEQALTEQRLTLDQAQLLQQHYGQCLQSYTYLEADGPIFH